MGQSRLWIARTVLIRMGVGLLGIAVFVFGFFETLGIGYGAFPIMLGGVVLFSYGIVGRRNHNYAWALTAGIVIVLILIDATSGR